MCPKKLLLIVLLALCGKAYSQCGGQIMEPGFAFLTSSRGCAPFTVQIETNYLNSTVGTTYYVDWGDGSPLETYNHTDPMAPGVIIQHTYPNSPIDCGYNVLIDAENVCNPLGSVVPVETQVIVWTNDIISIDPGIFRVCQGFAADLQFTDNSDWNCFPRATRENGEARWIQWIYGTGAPGNRVPGIQIDGVTPASFQYLDPAPNTNPKHPILGPGDLSLEVNVPITTPADIGKEFQVTLKNWNQCNAYDNDLTDGNAFNPVNGDLVNGDNMPQTTTARIVIVETPTPDFQTRLGNSSGAIQSTFCIDETIYFENLTGAIAGATFQYTWEFYDGNTDSDPLLSTSSSANPTFAFSNSGQKLIRLRVTDTNAAGNCEAVFDAYVSISPSLVAQIGVSDLSNNPITPSFCQDVSVSQSFDVRFSDVSIGAPTADTKWRWEFFDENNNLVNEVPAAGGFSSSPLGPFDEVFTNIGVYTVKLIIRDAVTTCESTDEVQVIVYPSPAAEFNFTEVCEDLMTHFTDVSSLSPLNGESITQWEWDFNYDGSTFSPDASYNNQMDFDYDFAGAGSYDVALKVTTDQNCSNTVVNTVSVYNLPIAEIEADTTIGCNTLIVNFTNEGVGMQPETIDQYIWEINQGSGYVTDSIQSPAEPGFSKIFQKTFENNTETDIVYEVRLRSITINGCESISNPITITIQPAAKAGFNSVNYSPFADNCSPIVVDFAVDAETQSLAPTYNWTVSDENGVLYQENTGNTPSFNHEFINDSESIKNFYVTLNAQLSSGCSGDSTLTIRVNPVPGSEFTIDTLSVTCEAMLLRLEALQKGLSNYSWTVQINGTTVFTTGGDVFEYEVDKANLDLSVDFSLQTENFANCESEITTQSIIVAAREDIEADFDVSPLDQVLPESTIFITNLTNSGDWDYLWDFGDGNTSSDPDISEYTYSSYGTYTITLTVSGSSCSETVVKTINIDPIPPMVDFDYDPASGCAPLTVRFTNLSQYSDENSYHWTFGADQGTSTSINPVYTYFEPGVYTVSLSASNILGDTITETKSMVIEVFEQPTAAFEVRPNVVMIPDNPIYTSNRSIGAESFFWDFGDGNTSTDPEPVHQYTDIGTFNITIVAKNSSGCADTLIRMGIVEAKDAGRVLVPNAFTPNLSGPIGGETGPVAGVNDVFLPLTRKVKEFEMLIFNRWGELLFRSTDQYIGWDGYYNGKLCPQDVYIYKLNLIFENGEKHTRVGDVNLIR